MKEDSKFLKDFFLSVYQVFFLDAKERYSITEACLEKYERNFENSSRVQKVFNRNFEPCENYLLSFQIYSRRKHCIRCLNRLAVELVCPLRNNHLNHFVYNRNI